MSNNTNTTPMAAFATRPLSQEGIKIELCLPDGTPTEHFLVVRGADCREFKGAQAKASRMSIQLLQDKEKLNDEELAERRHCIEVEQVAALVADWSFDEECSRENVVQFLMDAPQIHDQINKFAGNRRNFSVKPSKS